MDLVHSRSLRTNNESLRRRAIPLPDHVVRVVHINKWVPVKSKALGPQLPYRGNGLLTEDGSLFQSQSRRSWSSKSCQLSEQVYSTEIEYHKVNRYHSTSSRMVKMVGNRPLRYDQKDFFRAFYDVFFSKSSTFRRKDNLQFTEPCEQTDEIPNHPRAPHRRCSPPPAIM